MPDKWPLANGNWSNAANWNGGTKPVAGDDVYADGKTLNVDESFTVATIRNTQRSGGTIGGVFNFNTAGVIGNVTSVTFGTTNAIIFANASGDATLISVDPIIFSTTVGIININITGNGNVILTAPSLSLTTVGGNSNGYSGISKTGNGTLTINGNLSLNNSSSGFSVINLILSSAGDVIINGVINSILGGGITNSGGSCSMIRITGGNLTVNGAVNAPGVFYFATSTSLHASIFLQAGILLTVNGNIIGGTGIVIFTAASTNVITGNVTASSGGPSVYSISNTLLTINGSVTANSASPAVVSTSAAATNIFTGPFINTNNTMAVQCVDMVLTADANTYWDFNDIILYSPERLAFYPSASDIRQGTTYADGTVSGSLKMPPATAVIAGTLTDNTTGSAVLTAAQLQNAVWGRDLSQMTETGSIGYRLARVSTTGTTGAQIASYLL
jgi:hypothetical protein